MKNCIYGNKKIQVLIALAFFLIGCIFCVPPAYSGAFAGSVTLEWSQNTEPDLAGYRAFVRKKGTGYNYATPGWEGAETTCKIDNLDETETYYFVLRAFDKEGYESGNSNEVSIISGTVPDGIPPKDPKTLTITVTVELPE